MPSLPLDNTHGRTTSCLTCHHRFWTAHTVGLRRSWNDITALVQHTRSKDVWRGMTSPPLDCTHRQTMSGVAFHHRLWTAQTAKQRWLWHDITALGHHTWSNDVGRGMTSPPLDSTHGRLRRALYAITALGQHTRSNDVVLDMSSPLLDSTHSRITSVME